MKRFCSLFFIFFLLTGCGDRNAEKPLTQKSTRTVYAMDTVMTLTAYAPHNDPFAADAGLEEAETELHRLDALLSVSTPGSEIYQLNQEGSATLSAEGASLLVCALEIADLTGGAFDPTVYPLMELWGFTNQKYHVPTQAELDAALPSVGYEQVTIENGYTCADHGTCICSLPDGGGVDLGGIAKGYAAECVIEKLRVAGVESAIISLGGNVGILGEKPDGSQWSVAIEDPEKNGNYLGTLSLEGSAYIVTSGGYERYFEENGKIYHHIFDRATGCPAETDLKSVTIISQHGEEADAFSTALFVMGKDKAIEYWKESGDFDMVLFDGRTIYLTPGIFTSGLSLKTDIPVEEIT